MVVLKLSGKETFLLLMINKFYTCLVMKYQHIQLYLFLDQYPQLQAFFPAKK